MRRRPGVSGIQKRQAAKEQFQAFGDQTKESRREQMKQQMNVFKSNLEEFALKHKSDIRKDPVFRAQFQTMCANIGVDPLASNKGYWANLLGFGDFYYQLQVQIIEACLATRSVNGGLMDIETLQQYVQKRRGSAAEPISQNDLVTSIKKQKVLGGGFNLITVGNRTLVRSVPGELNTDKNKILELAEDGGYVSIPWLKQHTGWIDTRIEESLQGLLNEGFAMIDDGASDGIRLYWFPCIRNVS
ncbi:hypothetical protein BSKO_00903 [Bryopsis sp. KO-2023]|nr:hypothetical protein BSKO_00903 [Bryopsis sp. KO-2023]